MKKVKSKVRTNLVHRAISQVANQVDYKVDTLILFKLASFVPSYNVLSLRNTSVWVPLGDQVKEDLRNE